MKVENKRLREANEILTAASVESTSAFFAAELDRPHSRYTVRLRDPNAGSVDNRSTKPRRSTRRSLPSPSVADATCGTTSARTAPANPWMPWRGGSSHNDPVGIHPPRGPAVVHDDEPAAQGLCTV